MTSRAAWGLLPQRGPSDGTDTLWQCAPRDGLGGQQESWNTQKLLGAQEEDGLSADEGKLVDVSVQVVRRGVLLVRDGEWRKAT